MDNNVGNEDIEANELLDETQRLRLKRDLLTRENEQLKSYLRLRQMESTATCEQLKSEIEQQIEQFEALGDTETTHLETLKSFRSEIEAIQCWNAKIRNKYFSRNVNIYGNGFNANNINGDEEVCGDKTGDIAADDYYKNPSNTQPPITDINCEEIVSLNNNNNSGEKCGDEANINDNNNILDEKHGKISKPKNSKSRVDLKNIDRNNRLNNEYLIMTRSKRKLVNNSGRSNDANIDDNDNKNSKNRIKRKKK